MLFVKASLDNIRNQEFLKTGVDLLKSSPAFLEGARRQDVWGQMHFCSYRKTRVDRGVAVF